MEAMINFLFSIPAIVTSNTCVVLKLTSIVPVASEPDLEISVRAPRSRGVRSMKDYYLCIMDTPITEPKKRLQQPRLYPVIML